MSAQQKTRLCRRSQCGLTLIELMVALALALVLTAGIIKVFTGNRITYAFNEGLSRLQENGRFAIDTLNFRLRMAGYMGCLSNVPTYNHLNSSTALAFDFSRGLEGFEAVGTGPGATLSPSVADPTNSSSASDWAPALPTELVGSVLPGSDVLVIHNVSAAARSLLSPYNDSSQVFVDPTATEYFPGQIAIVSDCQKASVFQMTAISNNASPPRINIAHGVSSFVPGNTSPTTFSSSTEQYGPGAQISTAETWIYYVGAPPGGGSPGLFQESLSIDGSGNAALVAEELVEAVDTMQVLYGIDTNNDNAVDQYVTADNVSNWDNVVTVRVALVMRSPDEYGSKRDTQPYNVNEMTFNAPGDRRVRQVFVTTIGIRNRLP